MSDTYGPSFFSDDPRTGALSYPQLEARRRIAIALATRNRPYPKTIGEGLTALGEGLGEGYMNRGLERAEAQQQGRDAAARPGMYGAPAAPATPGQVSEAPSDNVQASYTGAAPEEAVKLATATTEPLTAEQAAQQPRMSIEEWLQRNARNETGGHKDPYRVVGPVSRRGDYPYGKYQIMGENIPKWSKQYLGREITPQEFLADDKAQEQIARGKGSEYMAKYGPQGAARAWFAGENGMNDMKRKDTLGTHVAEYERRFNIPLVSRDQVVASAMRKPRPPEVLGEGEFNRMDAAAPAPSMPDEASTAMAYAPEGLDQPGLAPPSSAGDMLANLVNPKPPGLGLRGPDDSTFPAVGPRRDDIAASVAKQQGVVPPQQVAAGPAPLPPAQPQVAPALQRPAADPQPANPGPEPKPETFINDPKRKPMIDAAMRNFHNNALTPELRAEAAARLQYLQNEAKDEYTKQWTIWHERTKTKEAFDLNARERQIKEETHRKDQQGTITGAATPQQVDPRILGTPQSPQRSGIPSPDPKPEGVSQAQWSDQQKTKLSEINAAVDKGAQSLQQSLELINLARKHPGREWGLGGPGSYLRESPWAGDAYAFGTINKQITGKNFLAGYENLKGAGAIGEKEGAKAEQAQANIDPNMKKEHYDAALQRLEETLRNNVEIAQRKANRPVTAWGNGPNDPPAPDIGQPGTRNGRPVVYIGGNPAKDTSYKEVR